MTRPAVERGRLEIDSPNWIERGLGRTRWLVVACAVAAALLRMGLVAAEGGYPALSDGVHFSELAASLLAGNGLEWGDGRPTAHRAPGQVMWLALVYAAFGVGSGFGAVGAALLSAVLVVATAALARVAARRPSHRDPAALVAAIVVAAYPRFIDYATRLWSLSELLCVVLLAGSLAIWARALHGRLGWAFVAGLSLAATALTRPVFLFLPLLLPLCCRPRFRPHAIRLAVAGIGFVAAMTPWTVRNYLAFGAFVPVSSMGGIVFYQGYHRPPGGWGSTPWTEIRTLTAGAGDEISASRELVRVTVADIRRDPLRIVRLAPEKLLWLAYPFSERDGDLETLYLAVLAAGLAGAWSLRGVLAARLPSLLLPYVTLFALVFYGSPRFRLPVEIALIPLAAVWGVEAAADPRRRRWLLALGLVLAVLALSPFDREQLRAVLF